MPESWKKWLLTLQPSCIPIWRFSGMIDYKQCLQPFRKLTWPCNMSHDDHDVTCMFCVNKNPTKRNHTKPTGELWDAVDFTQNLLKIASPVAAFLRILSGCAFDLSNSWEKLETMRSRREENTSLPVVLDWLLLVDWIVTSCQSSKHAIASCHRKSRPSRLICACKKAPYDVRFTSILVWYCQSFTKIV